MQRLIAILLPRTPVPARPDRRLLCAGSLLVGALLGIGAVSLLGPGRPLHSGGWICVVIALFVAIGPLVLAFGDARGRAIAEAEAGTDDLTTLRNRRRFIRDLEAAVARTRASGGSLGLLVLDLDNFKELNDTLGHVAGDTLLQLIGPRLRTVLGPDDILARLGGDEFAVLLTSESSAGCAGAETCARALCTALDEPFMISSLALRVTASIGIASFPDDGVDVHDLFKHADIALYQAKASRTGHARYAQDRDTHSPARLAIAQELVVAMARGELVAHFQPQVDPRGRICGAEALVRWCRPDGSTVAPVEFLPAIEQAGLARALTRRMLALSLDELAGWQTEGHELHVAVNTTVSDLLDDRFPDEVAAALAQRGIAAGRLILEVTESSILSDPVRISAVLNRLDALGVRLSLDDFGTGFSSLTHLRELPVSELKVDRSFVNSMGEDSADAAIIGSIVMLARRLGIRSVAEGVEDDVTWELLTELGCDLLQGYFFSRPLAPENFRRLLARQSPHGALGPGSIS